MDRVAVLAMGQQLSVLPGFTRIHALISPRMPMTGVASRPNAMLFCFSFRSPPFRQAQGPELVEGLSGFRSRFDSPASTSPGLSDAGDRVRLRPVNARRKNASNNSRVALIRFDSPGLTTTANRRLLPSLRSLRPFAAIPNPVPFALNHLDSLGLGSGPGEEEPQIASKNGRIALIRFDSLASTSPSLTEVGYSIHSCPASARRQNSAKNGRIALIRFDSLASTSPSLTEASYSIHPSTGRRQNASQKWSDRFDSVGPAAKLSSPISANRFDSL
jgi:hypothetical protein